MEIDSSYNRLVLLLALIIIVIVAGMAEILSNDSIYVMPECFANDDCVRQGSCCHPNAQECVTLDEFIPAENCAGVHCSIDCQPCTYCSCQNGKCDTFTTYGCC